MGHPGRLVDPAEADRLQEDFRELADRPGKTIHLQARMRHKDGSWRQMEITATNLLHVPAVGGIVANTRDITERAELGEQLRQAQKMEAVGQLAGGMAHDFNNILTHILGLVHLTLEDLPEDDPLRPDLEDVRQSTERAAALTNQLLAFSRRQVLQPRIVDLNEVVREMEDMLRRLIEENEARLEGPELEAGSYATLVIRVESTPGEGTTFRILLPAVEQEKREKGTPAPRRAPRPRSGSETVLLVEDEDSVRRLARRMLEREGYRILEAADGTEAVQLCEKEGKHLDLVLSDVVMPGLGGAELVARLQELCPDVPVILTSGYDEEEALPEGLAEGQFRFLEKPYTFDELMRVVDETLGEPDAAEEATRSEESGGRGTG